MQVATFMFFITKCQKSCFKKVQDRMRSKNKEKEKKDRKKVRHDSYIQTKHKETKE